ncbi:methylated-DNA--[protein]-cysteine S-methyltransferase [Paenibacillus sp. UNC451MF]|uniref:methylated-DNA--[protein]-cysteine S-methyltransferase n=1 Tax=Paenibacillus sp. UNC451MF TaxID=1449063 RepID=UPI00056500ED|nr:methylated-DNA--[protein]-cysteine S-methyltransferase [Paenibacillus sp. UNC451MF]
MPDLNINYIEIQSPIGPLVLAAAGERLCHIEFGSFADAGSKLETWSKRWYGSSQWSCTPSPLLVDAEKQMEQYFAGERKVFDISLDLRGTPFQIKVWEALTRIPYGQVCSYKDIGQAIQSEKAVRAVGGANNRNPVPIIVPCHRVIGADGSLVGYGGGLNVKIHLLQHEGYAV